MARVAEYRNLREAAAELNHVLPERIVSVFDFFACGETSVDNSKFAYACTVESFKCSNPKVQVHIPIIGNGDIRTPEDAANAFDRYGVDGIMIGRATFGHPWIFREIRHYLDTGEKLPPMNVRERVDLARRHLAKSLELKGEHIGVIEMRRHFSCYFKGLPNFKETRLKLVTLYDIPQIYGLLDEIEERWGDYAPEAVSVYQTE